MSGIEIAPEREQRSSVHVSMNAKGEAQVAVKVYEGADEREIARLREIAVRTYIAAAKDTRTTT